MPIHTQVLFNVLMGFRKREINGVKYSDTDYINRTLRLRWQLGKKDNTKKDDFAPKTFTKQEIGLKTPSGYHDLPIPDYVFGAILGVRELLYPHKISFSRNWSGREKNVKTL